MCILEVNMLIKGNVKFNFTFEKLGETLALIKFVKGFFGGAFVAVLVASV